MRVGVDDEALHHRFDVSREGAEEEETKKAKDDNLQKNDRFSHTPSTTESL